MKKIYLKYKYELTRLYKYSFKIAWASIIFSIIFHLFS